MARVLTRGAVAAGFDTERWTLPRITAVIARGFGIRYHPRSLGPALRAHGFTPQRPATQARARDDALVAPWVRRDWPRIQRGARRARRVMAFLDETGHTFRARVGATWAPRGRPPVLRRVSRRREVSSLVALPAPRPGQPPRLYARHVVGTVRVPEVLAALRSFRRRLGRPLVVVWDRLQAHTARAVRQFLVTHATDFRAEWLPSPAPDLNPEELGNGVITRETLNALPRSIEERRGQARRGFVRLAHRPAVLRGFFRHAGLIVT